jgi:excisionase family DNA binding protein
MINPSDIITPDELAERLKTSRSWVAEMTRARQRNPIPHYKIGRYLRFNWQDVCAWLESTKEGTTSRNKGERETIRKTDRRPRLRLPAK